MVEISLSSLGANVLLKGMKKEVKPLNQFVDNVKKSKPIVEASKAALEGFNEAFSGLSGPFEELGQIIGDTLLPIIDPITDFLYDAVDALEPFIDNIEEVSKVIGAAIPTFDEASNWFMQLGKDAQGLAGSIEISDNAANLFSSKLALMGLSFDTTTNQLALTDEASKFLSNGLSLLGIDIGGVKTSTDDAVAGIGNFLLGMDDMRIEFITNMGLFFTDLVNSVVTWINSIDWIEIASNLAEFVNSIIGWFLSVNWVQEIGDVFLGMVTAITDWIANIDWFAIGEALGNFVLSIGTFFANIDWEGLFVGVRDFFLNLPGQILQWLLDAMNALGDLGATVGGAWADFWAGTGLF